MDEAPFSSEQGYEYEHENGIHWNIWRIATMATGLGKRGCVYLWACERVFQCSIILPKSSIRISSSLSV